MGNKYWTAIAVISVLSLGIGLGAYAEDLGSKSKPDINFNQLIHNNSESSKDLRAGIASVEATTDEEIELQDFYDTEADFEQSPVVENSFEDLERVPNSVKESWDKKLKTL